MQSKYQGSFAILIVAVVVLAVGYFAFNYITSGISGPHASQMTNATVSLGSSTFTVLPPLLAVGAILMIVFLVMYYVSTPERYKKPSKIFNFLNTTTYYFGWGLLCFVIIAVPTYLLYLLAQYSLEHATSGSIIEIVKWIGIILGAYFGLAGFGYVMKKKLVDKWSLRRKEKKQEVEIQENIKELPGAM